MFKCGQLDVVVVDAACILYPVALARFAVTREAAGMLGKGWFGCKQKGRRGVTFPRPHPCPVAP